MSWDELYALFCVETGWTWEYVDEEMTVPRSQGFINLWKITPPLRATLRGIAIFLGAGDPAPAAPKKSKPDLGAYLEAFGSAGIQVERKAVSGG